MIAGRMLDTNVLLAATDDRRAGHPEAVAVLQERGLFACPQVFREYIAVATRPVAANGLDLALEVALNNVQALLGRVSELPEPPSCAMRLVPLLRVIAATGKQVHDANLVATMLHHGLREIVTLNPGRFRRFEPHVRVIPLVQVVSLT